MLAATWTDTLNITGVLWLRGVSTNPTGGTLAKTILVADESKTIQRVVEMTFDKTGYEVVAASSVHDALALVPSSQPVVVIADVHMTGSDGYSLCTTLKQQATTRHIPVLLMTRASEPIDEVKAQLARVDGHIKKPFDSGDLIDLVKRVTGAPVETDLPKSFAATLSQRASEGVLTPRAPVSSPAASPFAAPLVESSSPSLDMPLVSGDIEIEEDLLIEELDIDEVASPSGPPTGPTLEPPTPPSPSSYRAPVDMWALAEGHDAAPAEAEDEPEPLELGAPYDEDPYEEEAYEEAPAAVESDPYAHATRDMGADDPTRDMSQFPEELAAAVAPKVADVVAPAVPGLSREELIKLAREVIEQVAWEVVPDLAETIIRQELARLTADD